MERHIINPVVTEYLNRCYRPLNGKLEALRAIGEDGHVPIILPETEMLLKSLLLIKKPERILEIGTAIGYSAVFFAELLPEAEIYTVEKDEYAFNAARQNVEAAGLSDRITVLPGDGQEQVEKLRQGDFDDELLTVSQTMIRSSLKAGDDVMNSIIALQYQNDLLGRDYTSDTIISLVDQVSREDVIAMARRLEHRLTCIVGRKEDADEDDQK